VTQEDMPVIMVYQDVADESRLWSVVLGAQTVYLSLLLKPLYFKAWLSVVIYTIESVPLFEKLTYLAHNMLNIIL
jgi:hypothetical protein